MNNLTVINQNGKLLVDSREVAEMVDKEHKNLLRDIKGYIEILEGSNLSSHSFFIESTYLNTQNKEQPCFLLSKKGCDMVANKMTGEKGVLFTATYVTKFSEMEKLIQDSQIKQLSPMDQLRLQYEVIAEQDKRIDNVARELDDFKSNAPLFNVECKELLALIKRIGTKALGGYKSSAYKDNSLRGRVYSDIHHQLRREFGVERYEAIKRSQFDAAKKIVMGYKIPLVIEEETHMANSQITYEEVN